MAMTTEQLNAIREISVPHTVKDAAFRLDFVEREIEALRKESAALQFRLSRENDKTVVRGDEFDLLIETLGSVAKVTRCHKAG